MLGESLPQVSAVQAGGICSECVLHAVAPGNSAERLLYASAPLGSRNVLVSFLLVAHHLAFPNPVLGITSEATCCGELVPCSLQSV